MPSRPTAVETIGIPLYSASIILPLTPAPNLSGTTRKSYILQYAPDGAVMYPQRAASVTADNEEWQYWILRDGHAV